MRERVILGWLILLGSTGESHTKAILDLRVANHTQPRSISRSATHALFTSKTSPLVGSVVLNPRNENALRTSTSGTWITGHPSVFGLACRKPEARHRPSNVPQTHGSGPPLESKQYAF